MASIGSFRPEVFHVGASLCQTVNHRPNPRQLAWVSNRQLRGMDGGQRLAPPPLRQYSEEDPTPRAGKLHRAVAHPLQVQRRTGERELTA